MQKYLTQQTSIHLLEQMLYQEQVNYEAAIKRDEKFAVLQNIRKNISRLENEIRNSRQMVLAVTG
jgi:hypothetical protein